MTETQTQTHAPERKPLVATKETNEWGQVTDLEPHAEYVVIRKPTAQLTKERSREMMDEVRAFLVHRNILDEEKVKDLNARYAEPAKAKLQEARAAIEKRFDDMTKDIENLVERVEKDLGERGILRKKEDEAKEGKPGETPGEMPS